MPQTTGSFTFKRPYETPIEVEIDDRGVVHVYGAKAVRAYYCHRQHRVLSGSQLEIKPGHPTHESKDAVIVLSEIQGSGGSGDLVITTHCDGHWGWHDGPSLRTQRQQDCILVYAGIGENQMVQKELPLGELVGAG